MIAIQTNTESFSQLIKLPIPEISEQDVLIQTRGCGLCGTDLLKINLKLLKQDTVLGHEVVGRVIKAGNAVTLFKPGDLIVVAHHVPCFTCHYCQHKAYSMCAVFKNTNLVPGGFSEFVRISQQHLEHTTFKIPDFMDWKDALFTEPLACCIRSLDRLLIRQHDVIVIVGLGSIGLMMTKLLKRFDCHVIGIDTDLNRCQLAKTYGVDTVFDKPDEAFKEHVLKNTEQRGADGIIYTAGPASLLNESLTWIRNAGFVNLFSHLSGETGMIDTAELYHRELQIITSYSASPESLKTAFEILQNENLNLKQMFEIYTPEHFETAVKDMNERRALKALIQFDPSTQTLPLGNE